MSDKTEPASDKKLDDARKKGQVAQSRDLTAAFSFGFAVVTLLVMASVDEERLRTIVEAALAATAADHDQARAAVLDAVESMLESAAWICFPVLVAAALGGIVGGLSHVGFNVSFEPLTPKPDNLNPMQGIKKIFSLKSLFESFKSVVKAIFIGWLLYESIRSMIPALATSAHGTPARIGEEAWKAITRILLSGLLMMVVLGVIDYVVQRLLFLKDQKMSKDEVKREYKEMEGDPQLKGERKALAREIAMSDPAPAVKTANAVVVNPTHYAVALRYEPSECGLPYIVAKGVDAEAALIREAAQEHGIPIIGNPPLARALFKLDLKETVPEPLLEAVAVVLRWAEQTRGEEPT